MCGYECDPPKSQQPKVNMPNKAYYCRLLMTLVHRTEGHVIEIDDAELLGIPDSSSLSIDTDPVSHIITIRAHKPGAQLHILPAPAQVKQPENGGLGTQWQSSRTPRPKTDSELAALEAAALLKRAEQASHPRPQPR